MNQVIGCCSLCGGDVVGHVGPWYAVVPPPRAKCTSCGAQEARGPVIPMIPVVPSTRKPSSIQQGVPSTITLEGYVSSAYTHRLAFDNDTLS